MKMNALIGYGIRGVAVVLLFSCVCVRANQAAGAIISPDGSLYTSASANSVFPHPTLVLPNAFDETLSVGDSATTFWAMTGTVGADVAIVEFELDQVYTIDALIYAQRQFGANQNDDKAKSVSIWASETTAFSSAAVPGTPADVVDLVLNESTANSDFLSYALPSTITGRFFVLAFNESDTRGGNIGAGEIRFNAVELPEPGAIVLAALAVVGLALRRRQRNRS